jgi:hypothetical protein
MIVVSITDGFISPFDKSTDHLRLPSLSPVFRRDSCATQELTNLPIAQPGFGHFLYRGDHSLPSAVRYQQTVESSISVRHLRRPQTRLALAIQFESKLDQRVAHRKALELEMNYSNRIRTQLNAILEKVRL